MPLGDAVGMPLSQGRFVRVVEAGAVRGEAVAVRRVQVDQ